MKKPTFFPRPPKTNYEYQMGESIEDKVRRITENNEPIMPDCHSGSGCTIGTTIKITDKIVPNTVGVGLS